MFPFLYLLNENIIPKSNQTNQLSLKRKHSFTLPWLPLECCQMGRNSSVDALLLVGGSCGWFVWKACPRILWKPVGLVAKVKSETCHLTQGQRMWFQNFPWRPREDARRGASQPGRCLLRGGTSPSPPFFILMWKSSKNVANLDFDGGEVASS